MFEKKVELVSWLQNPEESWDAEDPASCGARGCFSEKNSYDIHEEEILKNDYIPRKETIFKETAGRGHGAVLDQSAFLFSIDNLTRASTLVLCAPQYASHLQQSLRRATAERGFYLDKSLDAEADKIMNRQFSLYTQMQEEGIPSEDARFILPLATKTAIQTLVNARELMHLHSMANRDGMPREVKETINKMYEEASKIAPRLMKNRETNYEVLSWLPSSQLFSEKFNGTLKGMIDIQEKEKIGILRKVEIIDFSRWCIPFESIKEAIIEKDEAELANLKHIHFTFLAPMSLATFHQMTRQRTLDQTVEPLGDAVLRGQYIIPKSIQGTRFQKDYSQISEESINFAQENLDNPNSFLILPHSLRIYDLMHVNGWNAIGFVAKRTCTEAQWEIRDIAQNIAKEIRAVNPDLGMFAVPQGILYGKCPEKKSCGYCDNKNLEKLV